ncbi:MAG: pimeloyl-ACP methyl ester carboxylesterase/HEAT repeat protein [Myxococcota bacterium]
MDDDSPIVRAAAARVFVGGPSKADGSRLLRAYQTERQRQTTENLPVRVALLRALGVVGHADYVPVLVDAFNQKGEQQAAIDGLVAIGSPSVRTLLLVVKVGDTERIPYALEALARIGSGVGNAAAGLFRHPREIVRKLGRDLMAASSDPGSVKMLLTLLDSNDLQDPIPVIEAISTFRTAEALGALIRATTSPNPAVRVAAIDGLGSTHVRSSAVIGALKKVVETDGDVAARVSGINAMYRLGAPHLGKLLARVVQYDVPAVRAAAYAVIGWTGEPVAAPATAAGASTADAASRELINGSLRRLTRSEDIRSVGAAKNWAAETLAATGPRVRGVWTTAGTGAGALHYRVAGSGRVVVGVAGAYSGAALLPTLDLLASGSTRTVCVDGRGRGKTQLGGVTPTLASEVADIETVRQAQKAEKIDIVGYDLGAYVAVAYATSHPQRVRSLTLLSAPARMDTSGASSLAAQRVTGQAKDDLAELDAKHAWFAPAAYRAYRQTAMTPGLVANLASAPRAGAFMFSSVADYHIRRSGKIDFLRAASALAEAKIPVTVILGKESPIGIMDQTILRTLAKEFSNFRFAQVAGAGHFPHIEQPSRTAAAIRSALR